MTVDSTKVVFKQFCAIIFGLALAINVSAQTVNWSQPAPVDVNKLVALQDFFIAKMGNVRKSCELDRTRFIVDGSKAGLATNLANANTKTEQAQLRESTENTIRVAPILGRYVCLTQFYKTLYRAYDLTSTDVWRYNAIELMLTDDLTDKKMQAVGNAMSLTHQKWLQVVQAQPDLDLIKILNGGKKGSAIAENFINKQADHELGLLLQLFIADIGADRDRLGCTVTQGAVTCD